MGLLVGRCSSSLALSIAFEQLSFGEHFTVASNKLIYCQIERERARERVAEMTDKDDGIEYPKSAL